MHGMGNHDPDPRNLAHRLFNTVYMASKRKKKKRPASPVASQASPDDLRQQADTALAARKYREAITLFKSLAKAGGEQSVWEPGLIDAYRGRALELQAKGMDREALTIWENRDQVRPGMAPDPVHLALLFRLGRVAPAMEGFQRLVQSGAPDELGPLRAQFAALYLAGGDDMESLSPDDPVRRDGPAARAALAAYCERNDDDLAQALRKIPFRSPYRDFATILKALLALQEDPSTADSLLGRVAADSPFAPLASAARIARLPEPAFLEALGQSGAQCRAFALTLRGWSQDRVRLWQELSDSTDKKDPLRMIGVLKRLRARLGEPWVRRKMRTLLLSRMATKPPKALFAELSPVDWALITALDTEGRGDEWDTVDGWRAACEAIGGSGRSWPKPGSDDALRIALIQRRMATDLGLLDSFADTLVQEELERSLLLDPDYLPGYLLLIKHYRGEARLKEARQVIGLAQKRWPDDAEVLNEALEIALEGGAFKKATGLARQILQRDPINRRARRSLWQAHVAHARKQWGKGLREPAFKELDAALPWADSPESRARTELLQALFAFNAGRLDAAALAQSCEHAAAGVVGRFMLAQEAEALGMMSRDLLKRAGLSRMPPLDRESLLAIARQMREFGEDPTGMGFAALQPFRSALKKAARLPLDRADYEILCETLRLAGEFGLCADYAKAALKTWHDEPLFELFLFQAKLDDPTGRPVTHTDVDRLHDALDNAEGEGDTRTAMRIRDLLLRLTPTRFGGPFSIPVGLPGDDVDFDPFSPSPQDMPSPRDMMNILDILRDGPLGERIREMESRLGHDELLQALEDMRSGSLPPPDPRPRRKRKPAAPAKGDKSAGPRDDEDPDQLKMF